MAKSKVELFDFAKIIGAHINFTGSYSSGNTFVNANLCKGFGGSNSVRGHRGWSVFGRSETPDLDEAIANLASEISEEKVRFDDGVIYEVPPLTHTRGYRG